VSVWRWKGWSRRYRLNVTKLRSGDPRAVIEVLDQLNRRERTAALGAGEQRMLQRAEMLLEGPAEDGSAGVREPRTPRTPPISGGIALTLPGDPDRE